MAHQPHYGSDPHSPPPYHSGGPPPYHGGGPPPYHGGGPPPHHPGGYRRDGAKTAAGVIHLVTGLIVTVFVLHILFVIFDANRGNGFVEGVYYVAQVFVLGLGDVFTPDDATFGIVLNYGLAALIYLVIGQLIVRVLRRS